MLCGFKLETPYESLVGACDDAHAFSLSGVTTATRVLGQMY